MDYVKKVGEIIERTPETDDEETIIGFLKDEYETIKSISEHVTQTPMYKDNLEKREKYLEETKDYSLMERWIAFLTKIITAPFSLMINGVVIFHIPMIEEELRKVIDE